MPVKLAAFIIGLSAFTFSCKNPNKVSLERQLSENPAGVFYTDTFNIVTETIQLTLPSTKNQPHLIVGRYHDELGLINAEAFTNLGVKGATSVNLNKIDTAIITFNCAFGLGDFASPLKICLYGTSTPLSSDSVYNAASHVEKGILLDSFTVTAPYGSFKFGSKKLKEYLSDTVNFKLSKRYPSLAFVAGKEVSFATGMNGSIEIKDSVSKASQTLFFDNTLPRFNKTTVTPQTDIFSSANQVAYLNQALGIGTKITIPGLNSFLEKINGKYIITEASFIVPSYLGFRQNTDKIFPGLFMYETTPEGTVNYKKTVQHHPLLTSGSDLTVPYKNDVARFDFPYVLHLQEISKGRVQNNSLVMALKSNYISESELILTQSPFTYSFLKNNRNGRKLQLVVYYNKTGI